MADTLDHDQAEPGDISFALDVEQLDLNLYRSKNLIQPFQARGVFGGQVISQALVSATRCVKPEYTLHVRAYSRTASSVVVHAETLRHTQLTVAACTLPFWSPVGRK